MIKAKIDYFDSKTIKELEEIYQRTQNEFIAYLIERKEKQQREFDQIMDYNLKLDSEEYKIPIYLDAIQLIKEQIREFKLKLEAIKEEEVQQIQLYAVPGRALHEKLKIRVQMLKLRNKREKCERILRKLTNTLPTNKTKDENKITEEMIEKANNYSLANLIDIKKDAGKELLAICPFHEDTKPSLSISKEKNLYYCFACNAGGNSINFVMKTLNLGFKDAVRHLCQL